MFWNSRPNEKKVHRIIKEVLDGKIDPLDIIEEDTVALLEEYKNVLTEAKWTLKYKNINDDKKKAYQILSGQLESSYIERQKLFCVNCKHISYENVECDHKSNVSMDYVTGTITNYLDSISFMRNNKCRGFYFEQKEDKC
jgi:hypothetical protein